MFPYQIYQALTDQRLRDLRAEARRHELIAAARSAREDQPGGSSRLEKAATHLLALLPVRDRARAKSAPAAPAAGAGPMGCAT